MTITYLYNPITRNKRPVDVTNTQIRGVGSWLLKYYKNNKKKTATVYAELLKLQAKSGPFSRPFDWAATKKMDLVLWWKSLFSSYTELVQLAKMVFLVLPTMGATERNWSAFGYIHSKNRNSLLN